MGISLFKIAISNPAKRQKSVALDFLADSGAVYSVAPTKILNELGILPDEEREFTLANGQAIKRKIGTARFEYQGQKGGAPIIFGEKGDHALLGATALEAMGFVLNPLKRTLVPLPMVLG